MRRAVCAVFVLAGCAGLEPGAEPLPAGPSLAVFAVEAAPLLERRCVDAGCHGDAARPFALYAPGRRRANPSDTFLNVPLTNAEFSANRDATLGFLVAEPLRDSTLLRKSLGELGHGGGVVFVHPSDPEVRALVRGLMAPGDAQ